MMCSDPPVRDRDTGRSRTATMAPRVSAADVSRRRFLPVPARLRVCAQRVTTFSPSVRSKKPSTCTNGPVLQTAATAAPAYSVKNTAGAPGMG